MLHEALHTVRSVSTHQAQVSTPKPQPTAVPLAPQATDSLKGTPTQTVRQPQAQEPKGATTYTSAAWGWSPTTPQPAESTAPQKDFLNDSVPHFEFTAEQAPLRGIPGDELPYRFKDDSFVTITLILSFFLMTWVFTRSRHYLSAQASEYFNNRKHRSSTSDNLHNELNGKALMIFQTCFIVGLIFFDLTQSIQEEVFIHIDPYKILGCTTGLCLAYYVLKILAYRFVNSIFFDRQQCSIWNETYLLHILLTGMIQLPLVLLIVYFDLSFTRLLTLFIALVVIAKTLLLYKCHHIFFNYTLGWVHLFLYFCTLEIVPLLFLVRAMVYANNFLLTTN